MKKPIDESIVRAVGVAMHYYERFLRITVQEQWRIRSQLLEWSDVLRGVYGFHLCQWAREELPASYLDSLTDEDRAELDLLPCSQDPGEGEENGEQR